MLLSLVASDLVSSSESGFKQVGLPLAQPSDCLRQHLRLAGRSNSDTRTRDSLAVALWPDLEGTAPARRPKISRRSHSN